MRRYTPLVYTALLYVVCISRFVDAKSRQFKYTILAINHDLLDGAQFGNLACKKCMATLKFIAHTM